MTGHGGLGGRGAGRGRSATGWLLAAVAYAFGVVLRWSRWRSHAAKGQATGLDDPDLPGVLAGIRVHDGPPTGPTNTRIAIVQDRASRVWAATATISHPGLALADAAERDSQGRGLAALLNACARTELVSEVLFLIRSVPDDGAERAQWLATHQPAGAPELARRVNAEMAATLTLAGVRTEAFCTIVVPESAPATKNP